MTLHCGYFAECGLDADHDGPHTAGMYPEWTVPTMEAELTGDGTGTALPAAPNPWIEGTTLHARSDYTMAAPAEAAAPDPVASRLWAERNHYLAGCACAESPWCAPHGWAGTVEPDDHSICADHPHVDPEGRPDIPDALKRLEPAPDSVASPPEAVRLLAAVLDQFDYWTGEPRPAIDGGTVRLHNFREVQPPMEKVLTEARRFLEGPVATPAVASPAPLDVEHLVSLAKDWRVSDEFIGKVVRSRVPREYALLEGQPVAEEPA